MLIKFGAMVNCFAVTDGQMVVLSRFATWQVSAELFFWADMLSRLSGQILLPQYLMNYLSDLDETYILHETYSSPYWWPDCILEVKSHRSRSLVQICGDKVILVDAEASNFIF